MSRTAKFNVTEANSVLALKGKVPVDKLVKKLKVSRSTIYRIFDGSYQPRKEVRVMPNVQDIQQMDELTLSTVQFILAKTNLEKVIGHPLQVH